jgi:hypothetical protein
MFLWEHCIWPCFIIFISLFLDLLFLVASILYFIFYFFLQRNKVGLIEQVRWCYIYAMHFVCEMTNSCEEGYNYLNVRDYGG